jgi:hypothetical protein
MNHVVAAKESARVSHPVPRLSNRIMAGVRA